MISKEIEQIGGAQASFKWDPFPNPIWNSSKMLGADSNNVCTQIPSLPTQIYSLFKYFQLGYLELKYLELKYLECTEISSLNNT